MILADAVADIVDTCAPDHDDVQAEMATYADREDFPIIGPAAGSLLAAVAASRDAERIFEFGSGFGYSATWFARGMASDGELILTELDEDEVALGREWLTQAGLAERITYDHGDALAAIDRYEGPFDVVLIDNHKQEYARAFEAVAPKVGPSGVVLADNSLRGPFEPAELREALADPASVDEDAAVRGIATYLETVTHRPGWSTSLLPIGNGITMSVKHAK